MYRTEEIMAKSEYETICAEILEAVGGSQNIKTVFHCITRLRIVPVNIQTNIIK